MKKLIYLLMAVLFIGSMGMEAKTTKKGGKKKSTATTTRVSQIGFGPAIIVKKSRGTYEINPKLAEDLQNNGFTLVETKVESLEYDSGDPDDEGSYRDFSVSYLENPKKGIKIKISNFLNDEGIYDVIITFSSIASENEFVSNLLKLGYKKEIYKDGYIDYGGPIHKGNLIRFGYKDGEYTVYYGG